MEILELKTIATKLRSSADGLASRIGATEERPRELKENDSVNQCKQQDGDRPGPVGP